MTSSTSSSDGRLPAWSFALAALGPLAVVGAAYAGLSLGARENVTRSKELVAIEAEMDASDPELLVIGNSLIGWGLDADRLGEETGLRTQKVWLAGSRPPQWYALLENEVYGRGHDPKVVVIATIVPWAASLDRGNASNQGWLAEMMTDEEPVLGPKVLGTAGSSLAWERLKQRRTALHDALMEGVKDASVGLLRGGPATGDSLLVRGAVIADPAMDAVFESEGAVRMDLYKRVVPVVETIALDDDLGGVRNAGDTLIGELVDLATAHGTRLVFAWMPQSPESTYDDGFPLHLEREIVGLIGEKGGGLVDLRDMDLQRRHFRDHVHLSTPGRTLFTVALAAELERIGALGQGTIEPPEASLRLKTAPQARRVGVPPSPLTLEPSRRTDTACGWLAPLPELAFLADSSLSFAGVGRATPIRVLEDGVELTPFGIERDRADACNGSSAFGRQVVLFSPAGQGRPLPDADVAQRTYIAQPSPELPQKTPAGQVYWIYPGSGARLDFGPDWTDFPPGSELAVEVAVQVIGPGAGELALVRDTGAWVDREAIRRGRWWAEILGQRDTDTLPPAPEPSAHAPRVVLAGAGAVRRATLSFTAPTEPWSLTLQAASDAPYAVWTHLDVRNGSEAAKVIGEGEAPTGLFVPLLGAVKTAPTFTGTGPPLPPTVWNVRDADLARTEMPELSFVSGEVTQARTLLRGCSPLVVTDGQTTLDLKEIGCMRVRELRDGRICHAEKVIFVALPADRVGTDWSTLQLALEQDPRKCYAGWWVYPGVSMTSAGAPQALQNLIAGGRLLEVVGWSFGPGTAPARLVVRVGEAVVYDGLLDPLKLQGDPLRIDLGARLPSGASEVTVEVDNPPDGAWLLLREIRLGED